MTKEVTFYFPNGESKTIKADNITVEDITYDTSDYTVVITYHDGRTETYSGVAFSVVDVDE